MISIRDIATVEERKEGESHPCWTLSTVQIQQNLSPGINIHAHCVQMFLMRVNLLS